MAETKPSISKAEMEVLQALWERGPGTIREVNAHLSPRKRRWAYTTLQTLLNRLEAKGYVVSDKRIVPNVFRAAVSREALMKHRLRTLIEDLCEGTALPLVAALVKNKRFTKKEIREFRRRLDELQPRKD